MGYFSEQRVEFWFFYFHLETGYHCGGPVSIREGERQSAFQGFARTKSQPAPSQRTQC
jgi:hypothetical protein